MCEYSCINKLTAKYLINKCLFLSITRNPYNAIKTKKGRLLKHFFTKMYVNGTDHLKMKCTVFH